MRMRKKPNLDRRLEAASDMMISDPTALRGNWGAPVALEIGCGKGRFIIGTAEADPDQRYIGIEREPGALIMAMEATKRAELGNVRFISQDASNLSEWFAPGEVKTLYLNFSDPWPKSRHAKRRLTYRSFLDMYAAVLGESGELRFKTDNAGLFEFSVEELKERGWEILYLTRDLHAENIPNIVTEYEERFSALGFKINMLRAIPPKNPPKAE